MPFIIDHLEKFSSMAASRNFSVICPGELAEEALDDEELAGRAATAAAVEKSPTG